MRKLLVIAAALSLLIAGLFPVDRANAQATQQDSGATGLQGTISAPPPTTGARITIPTNGQNFTSLPVTVAGTCPNGLLVKIFKNNVFAGAVQCENGSFSLPIDLFSGENILIARVFDSLDQAGPDSNKVTVTYTDNRPGAGTRPTLTTPYAKLGVNPGDELVWPIVLTGGIGPYAVSVDWGDGSEPTLISLENAGPFDITHVYDTPGVYNILIKATDNNGVSAFLQVVGIANGPLSQEDRSTEDDEGDGGGETRTVVLWQVSLALFPFTVLSFWLGRRNQMKEIKTKIARGERPF